jgi:hypothetical protein
MEKNSSVSPKTKQASSKTEKEKCGSCLWRKLGPRYVVVMSNLKQALQKKL